jgi:hypothetical protein
LLSLEFPEREASRFLAALGPNLWGPVVSFPLSPYDLLLKHPYS